MVKDLHPDAVTSVKINVKDLDTRATIPKELVSHPDHYNQTPLECIDAIKGSMSSEAFEGFLKGNVLKYLWRYKHKGNPIEDLQKAEWYLAKLREVVTTKEIDRYDP